MEERANNCDIGMDRRREGLCNKDKDSRPGKEEGVEECPGLMYGIFNLTTNELFDKGFIGTQWKCFHFDWDWDTVGFHLFI